MTVSVRSVLVSALVALALLAAYLLGGDRGPQPAQAAGPEETATLERQLTMTGTGEASAVPDRLSFGVRVSVTRPDLDDALDAANRTMASVLATLDERGVPKSDVQTTGLSMDPVYDYHPYDPPTLTGYRVAEQARVTADLRGGGAVVSAVVATGGNDVRVSGLKLQVADDDAVMGDARAAAVAEARAKAEEYAAASGQALGDVVTIKEVRAKPVPTPTVALSQRTAADAFKAVPIRAGKQEGSVTVRIVWELV